MDLEAINQFGLEHAMERLLSDDFRHLANQEYNRLLFIENMPAQETEVLIERLGAYRLELESSINWH